MATLNLTAPPPTFILTRHKHPATLFPIHLTAAPHAPRSVLLSSRRSSSSKTVCSYKVVIEHDGQESELEVDPDESILSRALDIGLEVPHDCKLGVCMTCPAKLISGTIDQSEGMLSDDVVERGYALLCVAYPRSDCRIQTIPEEELLSLQLATAND